MTTIYEGVDGSGKTTDAFQQIRYSDEQYIHNWCKPKNEIDTNSEVMKEIMLIKSGFDIVMDRSYILSEYIYSKILRRKSYVTENTFFSFIRLLNAYDVKVKLYLAKDITLLKQKDEDKELPTEELNNYYKLIFTNWARLDNLEVIYIDDREQKDEDS